MQELNDGITFLINNLTERQDLRVMNWLNGLHTKDDKARLAKIVIALARSGGSNPAEQT